MARCTVARLMRAMGLEGIIRGKPIRTTVSDKAKPCPLPITLIASSMPRAPNMLWVSDFTYVATWTGFVYVAFVIDTYAPPDRRLAGEPDGACQRLRPGRLCLEQALHDRRPVQGKQARAPQRLEAANTSPSDTPSAWRRPASSLRWVASATLDLTMLSPKPSTASTRPRSSIGVDHGAHARPSSSPRSNGSTGSTIAGCWNPSATSRRPKPRSVTTPC